MKHSYFIIVVFFLLFVDAFSQAGISVSPGRLYYHEAPGRQDTQIIQVTNPTSRELEVGVSFSDWNYDENGNNQLLEAGSLDISCTDWIRVLSGTYFILQPQETKEVEVALQVPANPDTGIPARTGMLFFTQLNPGQGTDASGAAIQVTVRMGVKIYHSFQEQTDAELEILGLSNYLGANNEKMLSLKVENTGDIWAKASIKWELFDSQTGKSTILEEESFHTLPGDVRNIEQELPTLRAGNYSLSAVVTYGKNNVIKIAELDFKL